MGQTEIQDETKVCAAETASGPAAARGAKAVEKPDKRSRYIRDMCYIALFAALLAICSWLYFTVPGTDIPVTLQTLGVCMAAGVLGLKRGAICITVYILLGICGVPVFSGYKNFYALIGSASAGYVIGFIFTAVLVGLASDKLRLIGKKARDGVKSRILQLAVLAAAMIAGVAVCYVFGTLWYMLIYKGSATTSNLQIALAYCVYPYLLPDFVKIVLAAALVDRLKKYVK